MATALDTKIAAKLPPIVAKYGKDVSITRNPTSVAQPGLGTVTAGAPSTATYKVTPPQGVSTRLIDGENILVGDHEVYLPNQSLAWTPRVEDSLVVTIDGVPWKCVAIEPVYSGELIAVWRLVLRK
ncbi:MAG: hypothetical protein KF805_08445 [Phycisphaeraceae bacterium]|nr:hypothetical protein [Phycisphaeraceae bacterium]